MKVYSTVLPKSQQKCINIEGLYQDTLHLWQGIIWHCVKNLSNRQMVDIYKQLQIQLSKMDKDDIPFVYIEMLEEYQQAMKNRNIAI